MRIFIAINLNDDNKREIANLIDITEGYCSKGDFVPKDNLHLTLAFLGEIKREDIYIVKEAIDEIKFAPFDICFNRIGRFKRNGGDIYWFGVRENLKLQMLHRELMSRGIAAYDKKFKPHLTIGRRIIGDYSSVKSIEFKAIIQRVETIDLMVSKRNHGNLEYEKIY